MSDGLWEAVLAEREAFLDSLNLDPAWVAGWHAATDHIAHRLAEHPATPAEGVAEVAVEEEREAIYRAAAVCVRGECDHEYDHECASDWLRDHDAALTAKAKAEGRVEALREAADQAVSLFNTHPLNRSNTVADWLHQRAEREVDQ